MATTIKELIKTILGDYIVFQKVKWFPNKKQQELNKIEEQENTRRRLLYQSFVKKNDLCFDVGANMGNRVTPLLDIGARVIAVEPQENCTKYLKMKFGKKIAIVPMGLGETECVKEFHISDTSVLSSFSDEWINSVKDNRFREHSWSKSVKVKMTTLDTLIEQYGLPAFIKIDVEGYELDVLKGLSSPVKMISFEYTVPEQIDRAVACIEQIEKTSAGIECNYSVGESMVFSLGNWLPGPKMCSLIQSQEFVSSGFGDVYVRNQNVH